MPHPVHPDMIAPDVRLAGLGIWVNCPSDAHDRLGVMVRCDSLGASVWVKGRVLRASDLRRWKAECEEILADDFGRAVLAPAMPLLRVSLEKEGPLQPLTMTVFLSADPAHQDHRFEFDLDQAALARLVEDIGSVLARMGRRAA